MRAMLRRSCWLLLALVVLLPVRSSAGKNNQAAVEGVDVPDVIVKQLKVPKVTAESDAPADVIVKPVKMVKMPAGKVDVDSVDSRDIKIQPIKLEGIDDLPKKIPQEDEDTVDKAVKTAERDQGAAGSDEGGRLQTESRAETEAGISASQDALNRGDSREQAGDVAETARKRVREDYARAADGGPLEAPPSAKETPPQAPPAGGEEAPEILEPPPKAPEEGADSEPPEKSEASAPAVIEVPPEQP